MKKLFCILCVLALVFSLTTTACAKQRLTLAAGIDDDSSAALAQFQRDCNVTVTTDTCERRKTALTNLMMTKDTSFDIYRLYSNTNTLKSLAEKGYFIDLSGNEAISSFAGALLPQVQAPLMQGDQLVAVPTSINFPYMFSINHSLLAECGIAEDAVPKNMMELFDFIDNWNENYADLYPEVTPFSAFGFDYAQQNPYLGLVLEMYRDYIITSTGELTYHTDVFTQLMQRIAKYDLEAESVPDDYVYDVPQEYNCLIYCTNDDATSFFERSELTKIAPLPLFDGASVVQPFYLECAFINPFSSNADLATTLLSYYATMPNDELRCLISLSLASPVKNATFDKDYQNWLDIKTAAEKALESETISDSERADYEDQVEWVDSLLADADSYRYDVSPNALETYQTVLVPLLYHRGSTLYDIDSLNEQLATFFNQYEDHALSLDMLENELDNTISMVVKEEG